MMASELIAKLQEQIEQCGDMEVEIFALNREFNKFEMTPVSKLERSFRFNSAKSFMENNFDDVTYSVCIR